MPEHVTRPAVTGEALTGPWNDADLPVSERMEALLAQMTLEEKVAQLGSHWEMLQDEDAQGEVAPMEDAMSSSKLPFEREIVDGAGHLTRTYGTAPVSVAEGAEGLRRRQAAVVGANRFGIPAIAHEECLTGYTAYQATVYPTSLAWGATFDPELIEEMAAAIGADLAATGASRDWHLCSTWCSAMRGGAGWTRRPSRRGSLCDRDPGQRLCEGSCTVGWGDLPR